MNQSSFQSLALATLPNLNSKLYEKYISSIFNCTKHHWGQKQCKKLAKIRNRYNQVPHLTKDTNKKVTNSQLDTTNESQEVSPFPASDRKAHINRHAQRHSKHKTEKKHKRSTKEVPPWNRFNGANLTLHSDVDQDT